MSTADPPPSAAWEEHYFGGSEAAEAEAIARWSAEIQEIQGALRAKQPDDRIRRGFHAKQRAGVANAEFTVSAQIPQAYQTEVYQPGVSYPAVVRLSNASGIVQKDQKSDLRGLAVRIQLGPNSDMDLLATNGPVSFARDAQQFMELAKATAGSRLLMIPKLIGAVGVRETIRMLRTVARNTRRAVMSLAAERYWSRGAYRHGDEAIRFMFVPMADAAPPPSKDDPDYLRTEFVARLGDEAVSWNLMVQPFRDETTTPIEDAARRWNTEHTIVARLTLPSQDLTAPESTKAEENIDRMEFNPWNTTPEHRPLGNINRARLKVYEASQDLRRPE